MADSSSILDTSTRPISEVVITPPCHGGITSSNLVWVAHGGALVFDGVSDIWLNANSIVRFERVSAPIAA